MTLAVVAVSAGGTLVLGGVSVTEVRASRISAVDRSLIAVAAQITGNTSDPIAAALLAVDSSPIALALGFQAPGSGYAWLREIPGSSVPVPTFKERRQALTGPIGSHSIFRAIGVRLSDGSELVVLASIEGIEQQTANAIVFVASFWILLSLLMGIVIRMLVQRDVREIEHLVALAKEIANGSELISLPDSARAAEVDELAKALRRMVLSLRGAVLVEQRANQRMQEFLGDASHELRTPLTVIKGYLELLERDVPPEQRDRAMHRLRAESRRMELLINDLLLLAEIGAPAPEAVESIDLSEMVHVMVDVLQELQPERPVSAEIADGVLIRAVPAHVDRAIGNAMSNIRRHTKTDDAVHVLLQARGQSAELSIDDAGPGLSADMYSRGITHFQRFDRSRSRGTGGSGLGMSIMAAVMDELGGTVSIAPSALGGLRIAYSFPLAT